MIEIVQDGTSTIHLQGEYDSGNAAWIVEQVKGLLEAYSAAVVLDFRDVTRFAPEAAAAVEQARLACEARGVPLIEADAGTWLAGADGRAAAGAVDTAAQR